MFITDQYEQKPITGSFDLTNGLVPTFFRITAKQRLLPGYAGEIHPVTTVRKISAPCLKLMLTQMASRGRK